MNVSFHNAPHGAAQPYAMKGAILTRLLLPFPSRSHQIEAKTCHRQHHKHSSWSREPRKDKESEECRRPWHAELLGLLGQGLDDPLTVADADRRTGDPTASRVARRLKPRCRVGLRGVGGAVGMRACGQLTVAHRDDAAQRQGFWREQIERGPRSRWEWARQEDKGALVYHFRRWPKTNLGTGAVLHPRWGSGASSYCRKSQTPAFPAAGAHGAF
jgi:hypothetical protein